MLRTSAATVLVTLALMAGVGQAHADSSGSLVVRGSVPTVCTVEIRDAGARLDLSGGARDVTVGSVVESCNDPDGYTVTFSSQGGGALVSGKARVDYTMSYDTVQDRSLARPVDVARKGAAFGEVKDLKVSVEGDANRVAGSYADTITVTIAAH